MSNSPQINAAELDKILNQALQLSERKMFPEAEKGLQFLLKILPNNPYVLAAYGKHNLNQKNNIVAEKYIKQAVKISPQDSTILLELANFYSTTEDYKSYTETLKKTLALQPANPYAIINYAYYLQISRDYNALEKFIDACLKENLSLVNSETLKIALAQSYYINNNTQKAAELIENITYYADDKSISDDNQIHLQRSFRAYYLYLKSLLKWRENHPEYYPQTAAEKFYIIGDSHSFGAANSGGDKFILQTKLVMDSSAWQLAGSGAKLKKQVFKNALKEVEHGAKVILSFGETDCRTNLGIHRHHLKNSHKSVSDSIEKLAKDYVEFIAKSVKNKNLQVQLLNCPAPQESAVRAQINDVDEIAKYMLIPKLWNDALQKQAEKYGLKVLDIYSATHGLNGWSKDDIHLDNVHFKPNILVDLLNK